MTTKQMFFVFMLFILALLLMTLPVWIDRALPIMKQSFKSAVVTLEDMLFALKFITEKLTQDINRLLDEYVFGS